MGIKQGRAGTCTKRTSRSTQTATFHTPTVAGNIDAWLFRQIMNIEDLRKYCLSIKGASESLPFDEHTLVYKVMGKMFAYFSLNTKGEKFFVNMKCNPEKSAYLMAHYNGILFGYHSDKKYWISVYIESDVPDGLIKELINHSVGEVIKKLPKKLQVEYFENNT